MSKDLYYSTLLDVYGKTLNKRQFDVMATYYNEDLSLSEIADNMLISKQGVRDIIKRAEAHLMQLEMQLLFIEKARSREKLLIDIVKNIEEISLSVHEMEQQIVNHSNIKERLNRTRELVLKILDE
mgnify:FL=1